MVVSSGSRVERAGWLGMGIAGLDGMFGSFVPPIRFINEPAPLLTLNGRAAGGDEYRAFLAPLLLMASGYDPFG